MAERRARGSIRVVIADDHALLREGLLCLLQREQDLEMVGEAANVREVLNVVHQTRPDVLLLDLTMPGMDGFDVLLQLRTESPLTRVLLLVEAFERESVFRALWKGARGYFLKGAPSLELVSAIRAIHAGEAWVERSVMGYLLEDLPHLGQQSHAKRQDWPSQCLSPREAEITELVAAGYSNKDIAAQLLISEKTVKSHLSKIFKKLQVRNRFQLALHTLQNGRSD